MRRSTLFGVVLLVASLVASTSPGAQGQGGQVNIIVGGAPPSSAGPFVEPAERMTFEVASVKPNNSGELNVRFGIQPGGRFIATNVAVRQLITFAYQLQNFQLLDAPSWTQNERYDIQAIAGREIPPTPLGQVGPVQLMVRSLLEDRFNLVVRRETREMPTYALVLDREDGRLGPALRRSTTDCETLLAGARRGGPPPAPNPDGTPQCGIFGGPGRIAVGAATMAQVAQMLSTQVQRTVIDKTGLEGNFDFLLTFMPDQLPQGLGPGAGIQAPPIDPDSPSIFTALQEQLGLRLQGGRGPVDVVIVERIERATPD